MSASGALTVVSGWSRRRGRRRRRARLGLGGVERGEVHVGPPQGKRLTLAQAGADQQLEQLRVAVARVSQARAGSPRRSRTRRCARAPA
ncbi:MAG TPA: hypothetical protein VGJ95_11470 [Pseudonocardiaceae bacterium]